MRKMLQKIWAQHPGLTHDYIEKKRKQHFFFSIDLHNISSIFMLPRARPLAPIQLVPF